MRIKLAFVLIAGMYAVAAAQTGTTPTQAGATPSATTTSGAKTTWDGVYTEAQAKRGEEAYTTICSGCHGPELAGADAAPSLTGPDFNAGWNDLTADDLAERIRTTMPADNPGSLERQQVADIMSFLFAKDGFPAGQTELPLQSEMLKQIKIVAQKPGQ